jgi:hypothetical protein
MGRVILFPVTASLTLIPITIKEIGKTADCNLAIQKDKECF